MTIRVHPSNDVAASAAAIPDRLLGQLLDHGVDGLFAFDRDLRLTFWSAAMERLTGLGSGQVIGQPLLTLFPFMTEIGEHEALHAVLGGKQVETTSRPFDVAATGRAGLFDARYAPLRDDAGGVCGGMAVIRDVTDKRRTERVLAETEQRFKNMADVSPVLLWMSRTDGMCTFFNQTWLTFTGRPLEEEWGVGWAEGIHPEDLSRTMDVYMESFGARRTFEMEYRLRRADGEYRWILDRGAPRFTPDGSFAGYIGSCVDITPQKRLEAELRNSVELRDEFLSIASHELRTPLTALLIQLESLTRSLVRDSGALDAEKVRAKTRAAERQAAALSELVEALLDVSRIGAGKLELRREQLDLTKLVMAVAERFRETAVAAGCKLSIDERSSGPVVGRWDGTRIEQVIANLLANAIKYGAGRPVDLCVARAGTMARISVRDEGIGIPPEDQARVFERFERGVSSRHYGGFGLGLWIARQLLDAHGGRLSVTSAAGAGATFTVELPLDADDRPAAT